MSKAIFCIATGSSTYLQLALNLGLSVKANSQIETVLLHTNDASADLGWDRRTIERRFEYAFDKMVCVTVDEEDGKSPIEQAHYIKLSAYETAKKLGYDEVLILDADTIILPSKKPDDWFAELAEVNFSAYCGAYFDFKEAKSSKDGYTYWCDPLEAMGAFDLKDRMPQINASFLYFKISEDAEKVFNYALDVWKMAEVDYFKFEKYNGSKTEEMCFNISCALNQVYPHQIPYFPVYFQYQHEESSPAYAAHYYNAISMAGNIVHTPELCAYYTQLSKYYRSMFGVNESFVFSNETKKPKDSPISLPFKRRTIWRAGELPNSDAGVFNPSGIVHANKLYTIFRKEKSMDAYSRKYEHSTALPHLCSNGDDGVEMKLVNMPDNSRCEDFRFIQNTRLVSHTIVTDMTNDTIHSKMALSWMVEDRLEFYEIPNLPVKPQLTEKNWVFFGDESVIWCIYSLSPYRIFYSLDWKIWEELKVAEPKLKWWQHNRSICNSTNPIKIDDYSYLMFFHSKDSGIYSHGACLIDAYTKEVKYYLRNGIDFKFNGEGLQKKLLYVSGAVYLSGENIVRIYAGEGDSHSVQFDIDKDILINELKKYKV